MEILVGADPEVFMTRGDKFISAHGAIPGDKKNPYKVNKGAVQVDGMALEFNIDPAKNEQEFITNINTVMATLREMVPGYDLKAVPVADFGLEVIKAQPEEARALGCEPDYNAYTGKENPRPNGDLPFRTGAGHVHIGWGRDFDIADPDHLEACRMATKQLDCYLGIGSVLFDNAVLRRTMYGAAGAFRPKSYGVEYRVLSNMWLSNDELIGWVYRTTQKAITDLMEGRAAYNAYEIYAKTMLSSEEPDKYLAQQILKILGVDLPKAA